MIANKGFLVPTRLNNFYSGIILGETMWTSDNESVIIRVGYVEKGHIYIMIFSTDRYNTIFVT